MKKFFNIIIILFTLTLISCASTDTDCIVGNDYICNSVSYQSTAKKISALSEFGLTENEWNTYFGNYILYKIRVSGDTWCDQNEVEHLGKQAANTIANKFNYKYIIFCGKDFDVSQFATASTYYGKYSSNTIVATHTKYTYNGYAIFTNEIDDEIIKNLRTFFKGNVQIYERNPSIYGKSTFTSTDKGECCLYSFGIGGSILLCIILLASL